MDPLLIPRPADDAGWRRTLARLADMERVAAELSAMMSQISATSASSTVSPWQPATSWADAATVTLTRPEWATAVTIFAGGHMLPEWDEWVTDVHCWGRLAATDGATQAVSPLMMSTLMSLDVSAALTWQFRLSQLTATAVTVATQAYNSGGALPGGTVSVTAVALWTR